MPVPLRRFSQNWLANDELAAALVATVGPHAGEHFLEIGPGEGRLTRALLVHDVAVTAVELDPRCCEALEELARTDAYNGRLTVVNEDLLTYDPGAVGSRIRLVGNLPYAITSPIIRWTAKHHDLIDDAHYMVPHDLAERMIAPLGSSRRGLLTVIVEWLFEADIVRRLGPGAFRPPPKIDSAFVRLTPREPPPCSAPGPHRRAVVRGAFAHRRKTLQNSLRKSGWQKAAIEAAIATAAIDPSARVEAVTIEQLALLADALPQPEAE